jgi:hypothetical protein
VPVLILRYAEAWVEFTVATNLTFNWIDQQHRFRRRAQVALQISPKRGDYEAAVANANAAAQTCRGRTPTRSRDRGIQT